jgi:Ca-activated chloride channel family protein
MMKSGGNAKKNSTTWEAPMKTMRNGLIMITAIAAFAVFLQSATSGADRLDRVRLKIASSSDVAEVGPSQRMFLKVSLSGLGLTSASERAPVNVALVLDRSGSMSGEKLEKAKEAAKMVIGRLGQNDIVSVVTYDTSAEVIVPATKIVNRWEIERLIDKVTARGNTALFSGVSKGAAEVRKFSDEQRVSRVILLSDGMANVGPSSTFELSDLGASFVKEGISVTTIGLGDGYNEDLMSALARTSDGNHAFAENATDLSRIFNFEFGDLLSVVAKEVTVKITLGKNIRPIRVLGRQADIIGNQVVGRINQLYADQEKYFFIEVELPTTTSAASAALAEVRVEYDDTLSKKRLSLAEEKTIRFSISKDEVKAGADESVIVSSVELIANEQNKIAIELKDRGKDEEAKKLLEENAHFLSKNAAVHRSQRLQKLAEDNDNDKKKVSAPAKDWNRQRKDMRARQYEADMQMAW